MKRPEDVAMALSYVDNCLAPSAIADFERRLAAEPELSALVAVWRQQNDAIRRSFSGRRKVGGNPIVLAAYANLDRTRSKLGSGRTGSTVTPFPARKRELASRPALDIRSPSYFLRAIAIASAAFLLVLFSACAPPTRGSEFRAEAAAAWRVYRDDAIQAPAVWSMTRGPAASFDALLAGSFAIPGAHGPVRITFDIDDLGRHYLVAVSPADAPAPEDPEIEHEAQSGGVSVLWSDGRRWIALFGPSDQGSTAAEAGRLRESQ
jgi:hypothetical protein